MLKVGKMMWKLVKPVAKRRVRKRAERVGETARSIAVSLTTMAPGLGKAMASLAPRPRKRRRLLPRVGGTVLSTGAALSAAAVYVLTADGGRARRGRLRRLLK